MQHLQMIVPKQNKERKLKQYLRIISKMDFKKNFVHTEKYETLKASHSEGILLVIKVLDNFYTLTPEHACEYMENKELFEAKFHNVELNKWLAWKKFYKNPQCSAISSSTRMPCKNIVRGMRLENFELGKPYYCHAHEWKYNRSNKYW